MIREFIVTKDILNIRSKATEDSAFKGQLLKNETVWLDDKEVTGIKPLGGETDKWLIYNSNCFVSKDGVLLSDGGVATTGDINWWFDKYNIATWWNLTKGENVLVSVFDSGIDTQNLYLNSKIDLASSKNYWNNNNDLTDLYFHGSHCSGLIAADAYQSFSGIAPSAKLSVIKVTSKGSILSRVVLNALQDVVKNPGVDIISVSLQIESSTDELNSLFKDAVEKHNKIVICAIGNNSNRIPVSKDVYPAKLSESTDIISVGALNSVEEFSDINYLFPATVFFPGEDVYSFSKSLSLVKESGSSQATAIIAGIVSLIVSLFKLKSKPISPRLIKQLLEASTEKIKSEKYNLTYSKLDVDKLFENLKSI